MDGDPNPYYDDLDERQRPRRPRRDPRGVHPRRLRGGRRDAHARPGADWRGDRRRSSAPTTASRRSGTRSTPARCCSTPASTRREIFSNCRARLRDAAAPARRRRRAGPAAPRRSTSTWPAATRAASSRPPSTRRSANQIIAAFQDLTDPANPGKQVVLKIMKKEELRNVDGTDSLHPNRSGDVVVVLRPPYQFDAATLGPAHRVLAVLRPARLPAGSGRPRAQRQHARDVHRRPGRGSRSEHARSRACGRSTWRRPSPFLLGHPRSAERPRQDPLNILKGGEKPARGDHPQHQRLARPADPARGGAGHRHRDRGGRTRPSRSAARPS